MTTRTPTAGTALAAVLIAALAACGGDDSDAVSTDTGATTADAPSATDPEADTTAVTTPITEPPPVTDSTAAPTTVEPAATTPPPTEPPALQPSPPLVGATELLIDGVTALPDVSFPGFVPPGEPGRYHSYRLGTEIVFDIPDPFDMGLHEAGSIAWDLEDIDRVLSFSRWGENESLGPDEWVEELLTSDWDVTESDWPDISGNPVRHFDATPIGDRFLGGVSASQALFFRGGIPKTIWIVEQTDGQPIVIATDVLDDTWRDLVDGVVASIELGPTQPDPRIGRAPIEYGSGWSAEAGASYRTLLFDDAILSFADDTEGDTGGQYLGLGVPGEFTGTRQPIVEIGAVGRLVLPDLSGDRPTDAASFRDHMKSLAADGLISELRPVDTTATLLDQPTTLVEFDVPDGAEVYPGVSEPDGWSALKLYTLEPARTYRMWTADIGDQVAIVLAKADADNTADLDQATAYAETVMDAFRTD